MLQVSSLLPRYTKARVRHASSVATLGLGFYLCCLEKLLKG